MATEAELEKMVIRILGDAAQYEKTLRDAEKSTKSFTQNIGKSLTRVGSQMQAMGRSLTLRLTAPIVAMGAASVKAFADFDQAMIESTSIMGNLTDATQERMRRLALSLSFSGKVLQAPKDLAESYFFLASAGKDAEQSMALLPAVSTFATAGAFNMAKATDLLTDAQSALGMASKNALEDQRNLVAIGDALVKANTLANASVEQFATSLTTKAGSAFKAYNIDLNQGVALLAAYADQGIKAELAGNAVDRMVRLLTKATADNSEVFRRLGIDVFDVTGEFNDFSEIIRDIENALEGMSTKQKSATLSALGFEARVQQVILPLLGTSDALEEYAKQLDNAGGITKEVAEKQMKSFANQLRKAWNQIKVVAIGIGETLAPLITRLNEKIAMGIRWWEGLSLATRRWILLGAGITAALGPVLVIVGTLISSLGAIVTGISVLAPFAPAIIAIGLAVAAAVAAFVRWGNLLKDRLSPVFRDMVNLWQEDLLPLLRDMEVETREVREVLSDLFDVVALQQIDLFVAKMQLAVDVIRALAKELKDAAISNKASEMLGFDVRSILPKAVGKQVGEAIGDFVRERQKGAASGIPAIGGDVVEKKLATLDLRAAAREQEKINKFFAQRGQAMEQQTVDSFFEGILRAANAEVVKGEQRKVINEFFKPSVIRNTEAEQAQVNAFFGGPAVAEVQRTMDRRVQAGGIQGAAFGGAEARGRIAAFRSAGPQASAQERTAKGVEDIFSVLNDTGIVVKDPGLSAAGLST